MMPVPPENSKAESVGTPQPLVSVLLPVYNGSRYLAAAIESVLRQAWRDFELIVIDDGSTDDSATIAASFADPRVVILRSERNLGLVATLNRGLESARGELVARLDADDVADPRRLEAQVARFRADACLVALGTAITYIDHEGAVVSRPGRQARGSAMLRWRLLRGTCLYHPTLMLHRGRAGAEARYDAAFEHAEDYELLLRLSRRYDLDNLPDRLVAQRLHAESVSARFRGVQRESAARALIEHIGLCYGLDVEPGCARTLLDPRYFFTAACDEADDPVGLMLELERRFLASESKLARQDLKAVRRDVAFFLWKLTAIALTDWRGGTFLGRRAASVGRSVVALARRPSAALIALVWR
jgi:glycosyltransferase involved in cell wall biosynthesis